MGDALRELRTCVERDQGMAVLTAPAGAGKTLLCRRLCRELADRYACAFLGTSRFSSRRALLQGVLYELGQPYIGLSEQESRLGLFDALRTDAGDLHPLLLVMDEAHLLPPRFLEELRTLADYDVQGERLIHVVLSGQLALEETLSEGPLSALNQRVGCHVCLESLTADESADYVRHRLAWAGLETGAETVFSPAALSLIVHASDGNPRRVNQLADHALLIGFADEERPVSLATVQSALVDLRELPLQWNEPLALSLTETAEEGPTPSAFGDGGTSWPSSETPLAGPSSTVFEWGPEPSAGGGPEDRAAEPAGTPRFSFETGYRQDNETVVPLDSGEASVSDETATRFEGNPVEPYVFEPEGWRDESSPEFAGSMAEVGEREIEAAEPEALSGPQGPFVLETGAPAHREDGRTELMSRAGFEEVVVNDRYAILDRRNESGGQETAFVDLPPAGPRLALSWPEPLPSGERGIEEDLRDLLIAMQSDVMAALAPSPSAPLYDVVEPEDEVESGFADASPATLQFAQAPASSMTPPPLPASAFESFLMDPVENKPVESIEDETEGMTGEPVAEGPSVAPVPERPLRRFAQLFSRLQRERGRMESLLGRERK